MKTEGSDAAAEALARADTSGSGARVGTEAGIASPEEDEGLAEGGGPLGVGSCSSLAGGGGANGGSGTGGGENAPSAAGEGKASRLLAGAETAADGAPAMGGTDLGPTTLGLGETMPGMLSPSSWKPSGPAASAPAEGAVAAGRGRSVPTWRAFSRSATKASATRRRSSSEGGTGRTGTVPRFGNGRSAPGTSGKAASGGRPPRTRTCSSGSTRGPQLVTSRRTSHAASARLHCLPSLA